VIVVCCVSALEHRFAASLGAGAGIPTSQKTAVVLRVIKSPDEGIGKFIGVCGFADHAAGNIIDSRWLELMPEVCGRRFLG
jgi:hypothetical protein